MRYFYPLVAGSMVPQGLSAARRSISGRMLLFGLPLLGSILTVVFLIVGYVADTTINRAISRNSHLQVLAMTHELERIVDETRNQLLILAAGPMEYQDLGRRLRIRAQAEGVRYRELAFLGIAPENRFLLLNYGGEVVRVPPEVAREARHNPFQSFAVERRPGYVVVSQPLEVVYSMVPVHGVVQSLPLYVLRMATPVYDAEGIFLGMLILSLDLTTLRDTLSLFSSERSPVHDSESGIIKSHSFLMDTQGWVLFQSESPEALNSELSTDTVRSGLRGDFGRPGFSIAFRPSSEHEGFWSIVADIQAGQAGQSSLRGRLGWGGRTASRDMVSYAPIRFRGNPDGKPQIIAGVATMDANLAASRVSLRLMSVYFVCAATALGILGAALWYMGRILARPVLALARGVREQTEAADPSPLELSPMPAELGMVRDEVNTLLERIKLMGEETQLRQAALNAEWQRQPVQLPDADGPPPQGIVGETPTMQDLRIHITKAAAVFADVLVWGETGTGKEMAASAIHTESDRASEPFISINCGALDENLLMDTLFGHVKGAFTEARADRKGAFLAAEGGTLMLDEIGNASPKVQQALLRALSVRSIRPLGSDQELPFNARIIAATNVDLLEEARLGKFREDLYYRLAVITIRTPPLRAHKEDIPLLASHFLALAAVELRRSPATLTKGALERLLHYNWPGNVRELRNTLTRAMAFVDGDLIYSENIVFGDAALPGWAPSPPTATSDAISPNGDPAAENVPAAILERLNRRQRDVLPALLAAGGVTRQEYQDMTGGGISMRTAQYDLQELVRLGLLTKEGRGPASRYVLTLTASGGR